MNMNLSVNTPLLAYNYSSTTWRCVSKLLDNDDAASFQLALTVNECLNNIEYTCDEKIEEQFKLSIHAYFQATYVNQIKDIFTSMYIQNYFNRYTSSEIVAIYKAYVEHEKLPENLSIQSNLRKKLLKELKSVVNAKAANEEWIPMIRRRFFRLKNNRINQ